MSIAISKLPTNENITRPTSVERTRMRVEITGASAFVNRMFEACGPYQWAREILRNSLEASATRVEFGIEWQAVDKFGVYRRAMIDNGQGMTRDELRRFFSTLGDGAKKIGGVHDNFGVGGKIATLPWNPNGVVVVSYKDGKGSMIWIVLNEDGDYELTEFDVKDGRSSVIDPSTVDWSASGDIDWSNLRPDWVKDHGTIVVLLGSDSNQDTILGNPADNEQAIKGLSVFLNTRFWDLSAIDVHVVELRSLKKNQWPTTPDEKDDARRPNNRRIHGASYYLTDVKGNGKLGARGTVLLDDERVLTDWYLWDGPRPAVDAYAKEIGYVAIKYKDELFHISSGKVQFRWFGVVESKVQTNLTIILEPQLYRADSGRWGVHPDQSRNRLLFTGDNEKGSEIPLHDWGGEFAHNMPDEITEAILAARGDSAGTIDDDEYRKRLQDKFGNRWTMRALVMVKPREKESTQPATDAGVVVDTGSAVDIDVTEDGRGVRPYSRRKRSKVVRQLVAKANPGGDGVAVERAAIVDVPKYRWGLKEDFEQPWHMALWDEPNNTVVLNKEAPVLRESIKYHQDQYAEVFAEQVQQTIEKVFGEVAVAKVAHSQKLRGQVSEEELRDDYRNEKALTIALMGLLAEESLIAQRLGKFGTKKAA
jgi:histidine kinase/DNA gyrase B/HSP90-like ATPase